MNRHLSSHINSLIDLVIEQKKLQFLVSTSQFNIVLFKESVLAIENDNIVFTNFELVVNYFLDRYKEKFNFQLSEEFDRNVDFIQKIEIDFLSNGYVKDFDNLEKEIWKTFIRDSNTKFQCSFNEYLKSIDYKNRNVFPFIEAYSTLLPTLQLSSDTIFENYLIQLEITRNGSQYNIPLESVLNGIKNKCKSDYDIGIELLHKSLNNEKDNILLAIISGLYENRRVEFYDSVLEKMIEKHVSLNQIFFGLANVDEIEDAECKLFLGLINKYGSNDTLIISILSLVLSILKSKKTEYHNFCFEEFKLAIENENTAYFILDGLCHINNYNLERVEIIVKLINQSYFSNEKYTYQISKVFWYLKDFDLFKNVVLCVIENKPFEKFMECFQSYFNSVSDLELDKFIIELLTNNQASKRFIGLEIFDMLSKHKPYIFSYDILKLPYISQYKLWVSLTQDFHEPKYRLVALLSLIDSKSQLIKESFICKLEEISEDYGNHITKILEEKLDNRSPEYCIMLERIKNYTKNFYSSNADMKYSIGELNPYSTHYKQIRRFNELFSKKMRETVGKSVREDSLLSILGTDTVQLSKGGGWRFGNRKEISQLGKVGTSFNMPRSYFINPNEFEMEKNFLEKQDWTDEEFVNIIAALENE